ncbi:O-antigen ligase family protein [uncultured Megasphaera sp.]|uniref:O-antigen ligase family protein n=1 Tax=uncultured Megasphaera sp. TaxID=165188 RepID=UPI0025F32542|nr:O-antigen ligase family protein [uncultured Megasphaera sp.]
MHLISNWKTCISIQERLQLLQRLYFILGVGTIPITTGKLLLPIVGDHIAYIFITLGITIYLIESFLYSHKILPFEKRIYGFLAFMFFWGLICSIAGVIFYPSFANIDLNQMKAFRNLFFNIKAIYPQLEDLVFLKGWLFYRAIRNVFAYVLSAYFISLWIYHLYVYDWKQGIKDLQHGIMLSAVFLISYSTIEVGFLCGSYTCKHILAKINVLIFDVAHAAGWWPPLFWDRLQLRSLFPEPSHLGFFMAFAIPCLVPRFFSIHHKISFPTVFVYICFTMMVFMSKARTSTILFGIEFFMFVLWAIWSKNREKYFTRTVFFVSCTLFAFFISLGIMTDFKSIDSKVIDLKQKISVENYVNQNVTSITGNQRSNSPRRALTLAKIRVGMEHPLLGTGILMGNEYIVDKLTSEEKNIGEVHLWLYHMEQKGPVNSGFAYTNYFTYIFMEQGIIGLVLFLLPTLAILYKVFKSRNYLQDSISTALLVALLGLNIALFSGEPHIGLYIIMGVAMSVFFGLDKIEECSNND